MKTKEIIQRLCLFLFVLVPTMPAGAEEIRIGSKADWQIFCSRVNGGEVTLNAEMTDNVDLGTDIMMVGINNDYSGTFDGRGYTLSFHWTDTDNRTAPFKYVNGATIRNLRTQGKIASDSFALSGLIYRAAGSTHHIGLRQRCGSHVQQSICRKPIGGHA